MLNGAFDSSVVVFVVLKLLYDGGVELKALSLSYMLTCVVAIFVGLLFFIPQQNIFNEWVDTNLVTESRDTGEMKIIATDSSTTSFRGGDSCEAISLKENLIISDDADESNTNRDGLWKVISFRLYISHLIYFSTIHLQLVYFVGCLEGHLEHRTRNNKNSVSHHVNSFGYMQLCGILTTPLIGVLFDRDMFLNGYVQLDERNESHRQSQKLKQCIAPLAVTIALSLTLSLLGLFNSMVFELPRYALYTIVRGFLYATYGAFIGVAFPANHFATLTGLGKFCGSLWSLLIYPLCQMTMELYNGNPFHADVILMVLVSFSILHPINVWWKTKNT